MAAVFAQAPAPKTGSPTTPAPAASRSAAPSASSVGNGTLGAPGSAAGDFESSAQQFMLGAAPLAIAAGYLLS